VDAANPFFSTHVSRSTKDDHNVFFGNFPVHLFLVISISLSDASLRCGMQGVTRVSAPVPLPEHVFLCGSSELIASPKMKSRIPMFSLLSRRRRPTSVSSSFRPHLESLEQRDVPSSLTFTPLYNQGTLWNLIGHLTDSVSSNANRLIIFGGQASGSVLTNSNGDFNYTEAIANLGDVTAQTADGTSNAVTYTLDSPPCHLTTFTASEGAGHCFTFTVQAVDPSGRNRNFQGWSVFFISQPVSLRGYANTLDTNGHLIDTQQLNGNSTDNGLVYACVTDPWGNQSDGMLTEYIQQTGV
jgi:hypothetical protein